MVYGVVCVAGARIQTDQNTAYMERGGFLFAKNGNHLKTSVNGQLGMAIRTI